MRVRAARPLATGRRPAGVALLTALALCIAGCDLEDTAPPPTPVCTEVGARCELPDGPLGVCERQTCRKGETPPCFQCTPQH